MVETPARISDAVSKVDAAVGDAIERAVRHHHGRRLRRHGWHDIFTDPPAWWSDRVEVRHGNTVSVLIDGHEAMPAIAEAIAGARHHVHIAGWHSSPDFLMRPKDGSSELKGILAEAAERVPVRLLMWGGPPAPAFQPTRKVAKQVRDEFMDGTRIEVVLDTRERTMHCHHEKLVIVDDEIAFVGGIDMTALAGNRLDGDFHPAEEDLGWHDVGSLIEGPAVADVARHFLARWNEVAPEQVGSEQDHARTSARKRRREGAQSVELTHEAPPTEYGERTRQIRAITEPGVIQTYDGVDLQVVRTVPDGTYDFLPDGEYTILEAYLRALRKAERFIYLENQFLWSPEVVEVLVDKLKNPPCDEFRILLVLPSKPSSGKDTTRGQLSVLVDADGGTNRLLAVTLVGATSNSPGVYVHAKVGVIDDRWLTLGSANLNEHSLFNDTEMNVVTTDERLARGTRLRLFAEHLRRPVEELGAPFHELFDETWRPMAIEQSELTRQGAEPKHNFMVLEGVSRRADRLQGPIRGLLVDG